MSDYKCPECGEEFGEPVQSETCINSYVCYECRIVSGKAQWTINPTKPTPETLGKEDALRILDTYMKTTRSLESPGTNLDLLGRAAEYLLSLKYLGDSDD